MFSLCTGANEPCGTSLDAECTAIQRVTGHILPWHDDTLRAELSVCRGKGLLVPFFLSQRH